MPSAKLAPEELDRVAQEVLTTLRRADFPAIPQTRGLTFSEIERTAPVVGQRVAALIAADALANAAAEQAEFAACPQCGHTTRVTCQKREIHTLDGPVDYREPAAHGVGCRRDFFPAASPVALG